MKAKNPKPKKAAKKSRTSLDKRIAAAQSPEVKRYLAMYGQENGPSLIQRIVGEWRPIVDNLRYPAELEKEKPLTPAEIRTLGLVRERLKRATQNGMNFFRDTMLQWDADTLIALGEEMKRIASLPEEFDRMKRIRVLLACGYSAHITAKTICEMDKALKRTMGLNHFDNVLSVVKNIRKKCNFKTTRHPFQPRKQGV
jgi:hypothetical protein